MTLFLTRAFLFVLLPLLVAAGHLLFDRRTNTRDRRIEVFLIYLFALSVAGSGIGGFISHFFLSNAVAESIGWQAGSPFQLEIAFANLALGVLGFAAVGRRDGFREATVIAATIFSVGAALVHIMDLAESGNLAPGNTLQNLNNLLRPALLIGFLVASRRAEHSPDSEVTTLAFAHWHSTRAQAAGWLTGLAATGFGVGYATNLLIPMTIAGVVAGCLMVTVLVRRERAD
ncbi:MAG: hypothetical protein PVH18_13505 [Chloroflexota bacterium]|jgi:hypothetical protein